MIRLWECIGWSERWIDVHVIKYVFHIDIQLILVWSPPRHKRLQTSKNVLQRNRLLVTKYLTLLVSTLVKYKATFYGRHKALTPSVLKLNEPAHDKTYNNATSEDSDQTAHSRSLICVFADRMCLHYSLRAIQRGITRALAILGGCSGWSESVLVTQVQV